MGTITDQANVAFRDAESPGSAVPHEPEKAAIREVFRTIDTKVANLDGIVLSGQIAMETYAALAALTPAANTAGSVVPSDTGTHTDPVVGGTVPNSGVYRYSTSPAGWKRIGDYQVAKGRAVTLFRTGGSTTNAIMANPDAAVVVTELSAADIYVIDLVAANTINNPTINIAGVGAKPLRDSGGDLLAIPAWSVNSNLILRYHAPTDTMRIAVRGASSSDPVPVRITDYLPVVQVNTSGNLWQIESAPGRAPTSAFQLTTMVFVVKYDQADGGLIVNANAIYAGEPLQLVWPSGAQVAPGQLEIGRVVEFRYASTGPRAGKWVISVPAEPDAGSQSVSSYYAAGAAALYAQRIIGR